MSMMSNIQIDLDNEFGDSIIADLLAKQRQQWLDELGTETKWGTFDWEDHEENNKELRRHIDAIETILKWYGHPALLKELGLDS